MTIQNDDVLLVNQGGTSKRTKYETLKNQIVSDENLVSDAAGSISNDGVQYARKDGGWDAVVIPPAYGDTDVNSLIQQPTANIGEVLSYGGLDANNDPVYDWVAAPSGGSTSLVNTNYTYNIGSSPPGQQRSLQSRLEDYVSVKDFGAVGDGSSDDTVAIQAAFNTGNSIFFPSGVYKCTAPITVQTEDLTIVGSGANTVIMYDGANTTNSFITLQYNSGAQTLPELNGDVNGNSYTIRDISILAAPGKVAGCGVKLEYTNTPAIVGGYNKLILNNVNIGGAAIGSTSGSFIKGLWLLNSAGVIGSNVNIFNPNIAFEDDPTTVGIHIENTMDQHMMIRTLQLSNFYIQYFYDCVRAEKVYTTGTTNIETLYLTQGELLGTNGVVNKDIHATAITNNHFSAKDYALDLTTNGGITRIVGNDIRCNRGSGSTHLVRLASPTTTFVGNYLESTSSGQGTIVVGDSPVGSPPKNVVITNNVFKGPGSSFSGKHAVHVKTGCTDILVSNNTVRDFYSEIPYLDDTRPREMSIIQHHTGGNYTESYTNRSHAWGLNPVSAFPGYGNSDLGSRMEVTGDGNTLFMSRGNNFAANFNRNNDGEIIIFSRAGVNKSSMSVSNNGISFNGQVDFTGDLVVHSNGNRYTIKVNSSGQVVANQI